MSPGTAFGDTVRVVSDPVTEATGFAGRIGTNYGFTTPSLTGIEAIGLDDDDFAYCVHFDDTDDEHRFAAHLIEFVDHGEGAEITLAGIDKTWVRAKDGAWVEPAGPTPQADERPLGGARASAFALTANLAAAWILAAVAAFYDIAWLVPPGQAGSPMDLRPINPAIASAVALLWSIAALLLALPSFKVRSARIRVAAMAAPMLSLALVLVVYLRA
jgi:hypothetical protein